MTRTTCMITAVAALLAVAQPPALAQSSRPGMGSTPYSDGSGTGVTFRVWAPNATSVSVPGQFNGWHTGANPLTQEGSSGIWSADISAAAPGHQYKIFLNGSSWKRDPRARLVEHTAGNSIVYDPNAFNWDGDTRLSPWQNDLVLYEMHVGTFNDPNPFDNLPGTFYDAVNRLDHLAALGINAVELMPIAEFPGDYSWGYNPADIFAVENTGYGGPDGLKTFVKACHDRGISVFLDQVHNHYGPSDLDIWNFDGAANIYFYDAAGICCTAWGSRPDYSQDGVRSFIIDNFRLWMDEYHIDGFRWDSVGTMRNYDPGYVSIPEADSLISYINNTLINSEHPGVISIAEDRSDGMNFDGEWDHGFKDVLVDTVVQPLDSSRNMNTLSGEIAGSGHFRVLFDETHDTTGDSNGGSRLPVRIDGGDPDSYFARKRSTLAAAVVLSAPGLPMLFMGQEMLESEQFGDQNPLDWNGTNTYAGIVRLYRDLIHLRRNLDGVSLGMTGPSLTWHQVDNTTKLLAYHRHGAGADDQVMVVLNFSSSNLPSYWINTFPADGNWFVNLNSDWTTYGADFGNQGSSMVSVSSGSGELSIAPYSFLILSRQALPSLDADGDGMLNGWEEEHFGDPVGADPNVDNDTDGMLNIEEFHADTLPLDSNSVLRVHAIQLDPAGIEVLWQGGVGATQVLRRATLSGSAPSWDDVLTNPPPTAISNNWTDTSTVSNMLWYRVEAIPGE